MQQPLILAIFVLILRRLIFMWNHFDKRSTFLSVRRNCVFTRGKTHETVLEINLNAISYNLNFFKSKLAPK
jgi:hypothetical protein